MTVMTCKSILFALVAVIVSLPAQAAQSVSIDDPYEICANATAAEEARSDLPAHLMAAIALAESGRWNADKGENIAWPWTVMTGGKGTYFPTKGEAVAFVEELRRLGVKNIDVGCMQVNLGYHGHHFTSIAEAFDPTANAAYAAKLLKSHHAATRSWTQALGNYHSTTKKLNERYKMKVIALWNRIRYQAAINTPTRPERPSPSVLEVAKLEAKRPAVDHDRTKALNSALKARKAAESAARVGVRDTSPVFTADSAAVKRARAAKRERERLWGRMVVEAPRPLRRY